MTRSEVPPPASDLRPELVQSASPARGAPLGLLGLLKQALNEWIDDKAPTYAASLAYYTVFSLAPTLVIALAIAGAFFGEDAARGVVQGQLQGVIGAPAAATVQAAMVSASTRESGILPTLLGVLVMVFAATGVFAELQAALNAIWKVKPPVGGTVRLFLRTRLLSLAVVLGIGLLLMASLVVAAGLRGLTALAGSEPTGGGLLMQLVDLLASTGAMTVLLALVFKLLPDVKVAWRDVWLGAAMSAALFTLGRALISLYLTRVVLESSFGAAGSLAALMVWVYYSSMTMLLGAELAQVYARTRGSLRPPSPAL
jgi:membrane protein